MSPNKNVMVVKDVKWQLQKWGCCVESAGTKSVQKEVESAGSLDLVDHVVKKCSNTDRLEIELPGEAKGFLLVVIHK